ncbi:hypothetical protein QBC43DRAFT_300668 [Cladorrhinum sp. PSN259]|nr:hypothetical protein QBC43DRAFT_300668 [Cladorrhinum sp. PSN259]
MVNGVLVTANKHDSSSYYTFGTLSLQGGEEAELCANFDLQKLESSGQLMDGSALSPALVIPSTVSDKVHTISNELVGILTVAQKFKLDKQELDLFATSSSVKPTLGIRHRHIMSLKALQTYAKLRDSANVRISPLVGLLAWLQRPDDEKDVYKRVATTLGLRESLIRRLTGAKYEGLSDLDIITQLCDIHQLASLREIPRFCATTGLRTDDGFFKALFGLAVPSKPFDHEGEFATAASLRALLQPVLGRERLVKYARKMQVGQRDALVSYLLQQKDVQDLGLWDADSLFEYFFIDVLMGPELQTTRTKQAVSTIQLYVQRCILGLEQDSGVFPENVSRPQWAWMQRFSLWEANRKLALYPENWIDPSLRDNKTDIFKTFERALLANDLSMETFTKSIRDYICSLHDISDLNVQAYIQDVYPPRPAESDAKETKLKVGSQLTESYHFFAATRTSPYEYYYRKMDITPPFKHVFWSPWTKIDVDIMHVEADWDGAALDSTGVYLIPVMRGRRLYLFMPQIMLKTTPNQESFKAGKEAKKPFSYRNMADRPVNSSQPGKKWEVRLAWSELIDGQWLPKKTSTATICVEARAVSNLNNQLPSIANFHFYVRTRNKTDLKNDFFSIGVGCQYADSSYWYLGSFDVKGDIVSVSHPAKLEQADNKHSAIDTKFNKYTAKYSVAILNSSKQHYGDATLNDYKISGLVYDVLKPRSSPSSKFTYLVGGFQQDTTGTELARLGVNETFNFPSSLSLKRAIRSSDGGDGQDGGTARSAIAKLSETPADILIEVFGKRNGSYHEMSSPYALYSWEICVHAVMLAMERLLATQQFELAIKVARLVFNPTAEGSTKDRCWMFPPFQELANAGHQSLKDILANLENATNADGGGGGGVGISEKLQSSTRSVAHAAARGQPVAYMKRIMVKYVEILMAAGDEHFRQGSLEALPLAIQRYIEAGHVLGPDPPVKPSIGKRKIKTFETLDDIVDLELEFPFSCEMHPRSKGDEQVINPNGYLCTMRTSYFSIPPNPELARLRTELKLRLYRIRNSLDIRGNPIKYAILEPSINPGKLASLAASSGGLSASAAIMSMEENNSPMPNYRFAHIIARAYDMCGELRSFGEQLLAIKEKKDGEALAALRARHDVAVQDMAIGLKRLHLDEARRTLEAMERTRQSHVAKLSYYLSLIGEKPADWIPAADKDFRELEQMWEPVVSQGELRMTLSEKVEMDTAEVAAKMNQNASAIDLHASVLVALPNLMENIEPMGMGVSFKMDAANIAQGMGLISQVMKMGASMVSELGARTAKKGQLLKQLQDRRLQANLAGHDIKNVDKQIEAQKKRIEAAEKEIEQQLEMAKNAREVEEWYKAKFTGEQLYLWMENSVRTMYYEAYTLAMELARRAERVMRFENGSRQNESFIRPEGYWDSSRAGLLAGQNLMLALKRMEMTYQERKAHDFEVTKSVSLRAVDPLALITLRETGSAEFSLPETLFDMDFPGHYMRRIKTVSATIPCVVGLHTSIGATLTLVKHRYRVDGTATSWSEYVKQRGQDDGAAFTTDRIPLESIAVSTGQNDSGLFELDFHGERFLPFEGAGLVSTWRLDLPTAMRQFDYHTIADVVLQVRYTARNGGAGLRAAASDSVRQLLRDVKMAGGLGLLSTV